MTKRIATLWALLVLFPLSAQVEVRGAQRYIFDDFLGIQTYQDMVSVFQSNPVRVWLFFARRYQEESERFEIYVLQSSVYVHTADGFSASPNGLVVTIDGQRRIWRQQGDERPPSNDRHMRLHLTRTMLEEILQAEEHFIFRLMIDEEQFQATRVDGDNLIALKHELGRILTGEEIPVSA